MTRIKFISLLFLVLNLISCNSRADALSLYFENPDHSKSPLIFAEIADTLSKRSMGLMYRRELAPDKGILFIFPDEEERKFWMKNTYLELDIIFLNSQFKVVSIQERATPLTSVERPSTHPAKYVLEIRGGSASSWGIKEGSLMKPYSGSQIPNALE